jgi:hypothetical protein
LTTRDEKEPSVVEQAAPPDELAEASLGAPDRRAGRYDEVVFAATAIDLHKDARSKPEQGAGIDMSIPLDTGSGGSLAA